MEIIAHRNGLHLSNPSYTESSLYGYEYAINFAPTFLECDVHITYDNILVINHDADYFGKIIKDSKYSELYGITTLKEVLNLNYPLYIENKVTGIENDIFMMVYNYIIQNNVNYIYCLQSFFNSSIDIYTNLIKSYIVENIELCLLMPFHNIKMLVSNFLYLYKNKANKTIHRVGWHYIMFLMYHIIIKRLFSYLKHDIYTINSKSIAQYCFIFGANGIFTDNITDYRFYGLNNLKTGSLYYSSGYSLMTLVGQLKTNYNYNHVGIIVVINNNIYCIESDSVSEYSYKSGVRMIPITNLFLSSYTHYFGIRYIKDELNTEKILTIYKKYENVPYKKNYYNMLECSNNRTIKICSSKNDMNCVEFVTYVLKDYGMNFDYCANKYCVSDYRPGYLQNIDSLYNGGIYVKYKNSIFSLYQIFDIIKYNIYLLTKTNDLIRYFFNNN